MDGSSGSIVKALRAVLPTAFAILAAPLAAEIAQPPLTGTGVTDILETARTACKDAEAGSFALSAAAYTATDLDGDGEEDDLVIDLAQGGCARAPAFFWSSGGSPIAFVLDGDVSTAFLAIGWSTADLPEGPRVILLSVHGSFCGSYGTASCVQAVTVSEGAFRSTGAALEDF